MEPTNTHLAEDLLLSGQPFQVENCETNLGALVKRTDALDLHRQSSWYNERLVTKGQ